MSTAAGRSPEALLEARRRRLGPSMSISYGEPLKIVRGAGQYLFDHRGRRYLDLVNNVCHVGHCHPAVVEAGQQQMALLNTNTRYLHDHLVDYAERLAATLPPPLEVCFFACSGSEANELAMRLARAHTGRRELVVLEHGYHGNSSTLVEISSYKFDGPGGAGPAAFARVAPVPDGYRGSFKGSGRETARRYAAQVQTLLDEAAAEGRPVGAFLSETILSCGGQIVLPEGYLDEVYRRVRQAGGIAIADEVQVGFGRPGQRFWAFETQDVVPDVVTLGKPIGNGHPLSAVVTTREIADSFANGMEYFNTFGGNPVSCAIGLAVLRVIEEEELQQRAATLGEHFLAGLRDLASRHEAIGDVRGLGLFLGFELVEDRQTLQPAADLAAHLVEKMKERGFLLSTDGPLHNVIKIKPPMVLSRDDVDATLEDLDQTLRELRPA